MRHTRGSAGVCPVLRVNICPVLSGGAAENLVHQRCGIIDFHSLVPPTPTVRDACYHLKSEHLLLPADTIKLNMMELLQQVSEVKQDWRPRSVACQVVLKTVRWWEESMT